ncbi:MAG TPA: YcaO-like family protein [Polyangiales bacterium]|nr:YcaO-like family protein [Polyangiales bacterium]
MEQECLRDEHVPKSYTRGTHRTRKPDETLARAKRVSARAGVTRIADVTGLDIIGLPVVAVYRPNARSLSVSQGKGLDLTAAMTSGVMEAIESYHAEHVQLPLRLASHVELSARARVVDVQRLPRLVTSMLRLERPTLWVEGVELMAATSIWVPYEMVHTNYTLPLPTGSGMFMMSSNGLASGNHLLEAISHGMCEIVERDAVALWSLRGGVSRRDCRIDPASIEDPDCRRVLELLDAAEVAYGVWDATSDVGLAAFVCVIVDREHNDFRPLYYATGSGCHAAREIALLRAITEAAQCRLTYICGARDDAGRDFFERARDPERVQSMRSFVVAESAPSRRFADVPSAVHASCEADVAWQLDCLRRAGISEVAAVDLTLPEFEIPVVRVVIPGLESLHDAPGYVPGARARAVREERAS